MSIETCGVVIYSWDTRFWLRDDRATGLCEHEQYSLFQDAPYGRLEIYTGGREWAIKTSSQFIKGYTA